MIKVEKLLKTYKNGNENVTAINEFTYTFPDTGVISVIGKSGCGKTSLLYALGGLLKCDDGSIVCDGVDLCTLSEKEWDDYRNLHLGIVFQDYKLIDEWSVEENLQIALDIQSGTNKQQKIHDVLALVGLEGFEKRRIGELSGGQKQRVAVARAIVKNAKVILCDEPTGNLDEKTSKQIWTLLKDISEKQLVIIVTHDTENAWNYSDYVVEIADGSITRSASNGQSYEEEIKIKYANQVAKFTGNDDVFSFLYELSQKGAITVNVQACKKEVIKKSVEKNCNEPIEKKEVKHLPFAAKIEFAMKAARKRLFRHILTSIMLAIALVLALVLISLCKYNYGDTVAHYISDYNIDNVEFQYETEYVDGFLDTHSKSLTKGSYLVGSLYSAFSDTNVIGVNSGYSLSYLQQSNCTDVSIWYLKETITKNINGEYPQKTNEIAVTDFVAYSLGIEDPVGAEVNLNGEIFTISGVILTDYEEYQIINKMALNDMTDYSYYKLQNVYQVVMVIEDNNFSENLQSIRVKGNGLAQTDSFAEYTKTTTCYGDYSEVDENKIILGRTIKANDEIVISSELMERMNLSEDDFVDEKYVTLTFFDLYDEKYGKYYTDSINMYNYFPGGAKIVGVLKSEDNEIEVYVSNEVWQKLRNEWLDYYRYDEYNVLVNRQKDNLGNMINKYDLYWDEPSATEMYELQEMIQYVKIFIEVALAVVMAMALIMIINCISFSVKDSAETIGILRSIGVRKNDTFKIFLYEMNIIVIVSCIIASIGYANVISWINGYVSKDHVEMPYDVFMTDYGVMGLVVFLAIIIGYLAVIIPVYRLSKCKPVELLNSIQK